MILSFDVGIRHLAYCMLDDSRELASIKQWEVIDLGRVGTVEAGILKLTVEMHTRFDALFASGAYLDAVLIERQPKTRSVMLVALQMGICAYFASAVYAGRVGHVRFASASKKLGMRLYRRTEADLPREVKPRSAAPAANTPKQRVRRELAAQYGANKRYAVNATRYYLAEVLRDEVSQAQLAKSKKKDDLCDAFLQGMAFLEGGDQWAADDYKRRAPAPQDGGRRKARKAAPPKVAKAPKAPKAPKAIKAPKSPKAPKVSKAPKKDDAIPLLYIPFSSLTEYSYT